ncbi:methyltransferase domain-containing protein [Thiofilum flexile]|uniref:methyltransferase domain-containing protein n=1 Tax=Thiofilum flexile TaxID=125627 RepID=UPI000371282B|nr:methyltransferase domain-containing protein [Thiofilum flexile]
MFSISQTPLIHESAIIDCRTEADFLAGHKRGAISIPAAELFARMHELPMRSTPLELWVDVSSKTTAQDFLSTKGYTLTQTLIWSEALAQTLQLTGQWATGAAQHTLWQPAPLIERFVTDIMPRYKIPAGKGLDLGCGAGRDLVYLAQHGWQMTGIDHLSGALQRTQDLAAHNQVTVTTLQMDLETSDNQLATLTPHSFDLIYGVRYLHRPLFSIIPTLLKPKGVFLYQTFMEGCEVLGGPRNPKFLLKHGELAHLFHHADIILDHIDYLNDGRPLSAFISVMPY